MPSAVVNKRIIVKTLLSSRYGQLGVAIDPSGVTRPASWDQRFSGQEIIETTDGRKMTLQSSAQQSSPKPGWILAITGGEQSEGYTWTLYGLKPAKIVS